MKQTLTGSKMPAYVAVYNSLYSDLRSGVYRENEALPGETALAEKYHVSRNTLRQALAILAEDGLIVRSQGRETLVAPQKKPLAPDKHKNPLIDLAGRAVDNVAGQDNVCLVQGQLGSGNVGGSVVVVLDLNLIHLLPGQVDEGIFVLVRPPAPA